jgi:uncharacterized membrane protein YcaP (DUF421 family)
MHDLLIIGFRTVLLYVIIVIILRIMGKRELGELGVIDVVVFIVIAEVASFSIEDPNKKLIQSILPMLILLAIQLLSSLISLKSKKFRDLVDGDPTLIIKDGKILEKEMRKQRYNLDDLFQQLREQSIGSVHEVSIAYLEPSGSLSVFTKDDDHPTLTLIADGSVQHRHLRLCGKTEEWLLQEIRLLGVDDVHQVFYCTLEKGELKFQLKETD